MIRRVLASAGAAAFLIVATASPTAAQQTAAPTFNKDIAPIFYAHCTDCHRQGEIAPMSLLTYKEARPWARSIATKVKSGAMPPWHADPSIGKFLNERRLTEEQKNVIAKWADMGALEGDPKDLPAAPTYSDGWRIGKPDAILSMQEDYPIPATGTVPYVYFEVPANFAEDRYITSWEMKPGNKAVVHHVIVSIRPPQPTPEQQAQIAAAMKAQAANPASRPQPVFEFADGMEIPAGQTGGPPLEGAAAAAKRPGLLPVDRPRPRGTAGSIGGYVPGNSARILPEGTGIRLPAGSSLVFQMHYTPVGEKTTDRTIVGMKFAKERPKTVLTSSALVNGGLHIPANTADHRIDAEMTINRDVTLWSLVPHTHMRGKKWHYEVIYPDGRKETILSVPNYDFEWQHEYMFSEPLKLPKGTKLHATAWYDNSKNNRYNPDPNAEVWWGDQTWEEMMFTSITFSVVQPTTTTSSQQ